LFCVSFRCSVRLRDPRSFPTRRSSDLDDQGVVATLHFHGEEGFVRLRGRRRAQPFLRASQIIVNVWEEPNCRYIIEESCRSLARSEEHTSELQSRFDLVCRLLLEKKKN